MAVVNFESVAAAAQACVEQGKRPSARNVRLELGGGSPNDILAFLQEWKSGRPVVAVNDLHVSDSLLSAIKREISEASARAGSGAEEKAAEAEETLNLVREELNETRHKCEALQVAVDDADAEIKTLKADLAEALASAKSTEERLSSVIADLQKTTDAQRIQIENLLKEAGKNENQATIREAKIAADADLIKSLRDEIQAAKQAAESSLKEVSEAQKEAAKHEMNAAVTAEKLVAAKAESDALKASHAETVAILKSQVASLESRAGKAEGEAEQCKNELKTLTDAQFRAALEAKGQQRLTE